MSTLREAALEALEALWFANARLWFGDETIMKAISSLQAALAQPETRNQCGETCERAKLCAVCARGLAQQALRDLERAEASGACEYASTAALRAALEQQEPVAFADRISFDQAMKSGKGHDVWPEAGDYEARTGRKLRVLYTHPPRREWQSLTTQEAMTLTDTVPRGTFYGCDAGIGLGIWIAAVAAAERALKEKNT
jgi:hypothetical protein